jgi:hypothetical protein
LRSMSNDSSKLRKRDPTLDISSEYCVSKREQRLSSSKLRNAWKKRLQC